MSKSWETTDCCATVAVYSGKYYAPFTHQTMLVAHIHKGRRVCQLILTINVNVYIIQIVIQIINLSLIGV